MKVKFVPTKTQKKGLVRKTFSLKSFFQGQSPDEGLLICLFGLMIFGWVMVYSSSALFAEKNYHDQYFFIKRQILWSLVGLVGFVGAANIPVQFYQRNSKLILGLTCAALIAVLIFGPSISGARRWLRLGFMNFQPSELAKIALVFCVADYMDRRQSRLKDFKRGLLPLLLLVSFPIGLILLEPDLGTPVLMSMVILCLLVIGGARIKHLSLMALASLPFLIAAVLMVRYRLARLFAYLDPWENAKGTGYQLVQSLLAMGSGGIFGRGLGESRIKISNLPDCHTDFVFAILGEELGLIGTLACVGLFAFLCLRGLKIAKKSQDTFSTLVASGISLTIGLQALINMGVACGLFPTKGMPLPFISFGGSSLLMMMISLGILANISRQNKFSSKRSTS